MLNKIRGFSAAIMALTMVGAPLPAQAQFPAGSGTVIPTNVAYGRGSSFVSQDGRFTLAFQTDGNIVLYQGTHALWHHSTLGRCTTAPGAPTCIPPIGTSLVMQGDGNWVAYTQYPNLADSISHTDGNPGASLWLQNDGNLVIYTPAGKALWSTETCCH